MNGIAVAWARLLGLQIVGLAVAVATVAIAAIVVPPAVYGQYALVLSLLQVISPVTLSWISQSAVRFGREEYLLNGGIAATLGSVLAMQVPLFGLVCVAVWIAMPWLETWAAGARFDWIAFTALGGIAAAETLAYAAQAAGRFTGYGAGQLLVRAGLAGALVPIYFGVGADARLLLAGTAAGSIAAAAMTFVSIPRRSRAKLRFDPPLARRILAYGWKLPLGAASGILFAWIDIWFIRSLIDLDAAGVYAWAYNVFRMAAMVLMPLSTVLAPLMADLRLSGDRDRSARGLRAILAAFILASAMVPIGLVPLRWAAELIVPTNYHAAIAPAIMLGGTMSLQLFVLGVNPLVMAYERAVGGVVILNVAMLGLNAVGDLLLIPRLGILGAAAATASATWLSVLVMNRLAWRFSQLDRELERSTTRLVAAVGAADLMAAFAIAEVQSVYWPWVLAAAAALSFFALRRAGYLRGLGALSPQLAALPWGRTMVQAIAWCEGRARPSVAPEQV
ncbi:MAG TPA: oligosaccharide flippase family protein [Candidatus Cybelea sp.]|nr:oligosaccharide flippase family protein [Candidatus Cybelea sp.]